jgi:hypothetical protein
MRQRLPLDEAPAQAVGAQAAGRTAAAACTPEPAAARKASWTSRGVVAPGPARRTEPAPHTEPALRMAAAHMGAAPHTVAAGKQLGAELVPRAQVRRAAAPRAAAPSAGACRGAAEAASVVAAGEEAPVSVYFERKASDREKYRLFVDSCVALCGAWARVRGCCRRIVTKPLRSLSAHPVTRRAFLR